MTDLLVLDHRVQCWVVAHRLHALNGAMLTFSAIGRGGLIFLIIGTALLGLRANWRGLGTLALTLLLAWLIADVLLKPAVGRPRPFVQAPTETVLGPAPHDGSFPSGHATCAFGSALALSVSAPEAWPLWWLLAVGIGYSRVYVGVHYPLDVIGGAALGLCCAATALLITRLRRGR